MLLAPPALAQISVSVFGGYAVSEGIENDTTGERASVKSGVAFGVAGDYDLDSARQVQLFYGQQNTSLDPGGGVPRFDFDVRYLHLGGTYFFDGPIGRGPYAVGGVGVTHFSPNMNGLQQRNKGVDERWVWVSMADWQCSGCSGRGARLLHSAEQLGRIILLGRLCRFFERRFVCARPGDAGSDCAVLRRLQ